MELGREDYYEGASTATAAPSITLLREPPPQRPGSSKSFATTSGVGTLSSAPGSTSKLGDEDVEKTYRFPPPNPRPVYQPTSTEI